MTPPPSAARRIALEHAPPRERKKYRGKAIFLNTSLRGRAIIHVRATPSRPELKGKPFSALNQLTEPTHGVVRLTQAVTPDHRVKRDTAVAAFEPIPTRDEGEAGLSDITAKGRAHMEQGLVISRTKPFDGLFRSCAENRPASHVQSDLFFLKDPETFIVFVR